SRSSAPLLVQKVSIRKDHVMRRSGTQFLPFITTDLTLLVKLHVGSLRLRRSILGLELGVDDAAAADLINRKRFGSYPMAILEHAEGAGVDGFPLVCLLLFFGYGRGRSRHAPDQRHHENEQPARQLHCDSPFLEMIGEIGDEPAASFPSRN